MDVVNMHAAKTQFSKLVERASRGEVITIARDGRPAARLVPLEVAVAPVPRIGFMRGEIVVPEDFDTLGSDQIAELFDGR